MNVKKLQKRLLQDEIIIMDGGTGTEILRRGVKTTLPLWSASAILTHPELIKQIHIDYIQAGAEIIITNTFRTQSRTFAKADVSETARKATILACKLAQDAVKEAKVDHAVYIAGAIVPLEECYSPELMPPDAQLEREHLEHAQNLKDGGVDFLLVETMNTIKEAVFAMKAAQKVKLPIAVSFCCNDQLTLLSGETLEEMVKRVEPLSPLFISINCTPTKATTKIIQKLHTLTKLPLGVYANGDGCGDKKQGWRFTGNNDKNTYLKDAKKWVSSGAQIIGGCCGTDPEYIALLTKSLPKKTS